MGIIIVAASQDEMKFEVRSIQHGAHHVTPLLEKETGSGRKQLTGGPASSQGQRQGLFLPPGEAWLRGAASPSLFESADCVRSPAEGLEWWDWSQCLAHIDLQSRLTE